MQHGLVTEQFFCWLLVRNTSFEDGPWKSPANWQVHPAASNLGFVETLVWWSSGKLLDTQTMKMVIGPIRHVCWYFDWEIIFSSQHTYCSRVWSVRKQEWSCGLYWVVGQAQDCCCCCYRKLCSSIILLFRNSKQWSQVKVSMNFGSRWGFMRIL